MQRLKWMNKKLISMLFLFILSNIVPYVDLPIPPIKKIPTGIIYVDNWGKAVTVRFHEVKLVVFGDFRLPIFNGKRSNILYHKTYIYSLLNNVALIRDLACIKEMNKIFSKYFATSSFWSSTVSTCILSTRKSFINKLDGWQQISCTSPQHTWFGEKLLP